MFFSSYLAALVLGLIIFDVNIVGAVNGIENIDVDSRDDLFVTNKTNQKKLTSKNLQTRIQHGVIADVKDHPSIVAMFMNDWFHCGGVILSSTTVISASHCVDSPGDYTIRAGSSNKDEGTLYKVKKVLMHPNYDSYYLDYDFALLYLSSHIKFNNNIKSVSLVKNDVPANVKVEAYGWGVTEYGEPSELLQGIKIYTLSFNECVKRLRYSGTITKRMLCASDDSTYPKKDTCQGDSGGPLYYKGLLAGLTSWGDCDRSDPGVYSNVYEVRGWIKKNLV